MTTKFRTRGQREADQFANAIRRERVFQTEATEKQMAFIEKLLNELAAKIADSELNEVARNAFNTHQTIQLVVEMNKEQNTKMSKFDASQAIKLLIEASNASFTPKMPEINRAILTTPVQAPTEPAAVGVYKNGDDYYRVTTLRNSNRRAAYRWNGRRWDYSRGMVYRLTSNELLSVDQVRAFGVRTGMCAVCGRTLTDAESVQKGIGPVCERRYGRL